MVIVPQNSYGDNFVNNLQDSWICLLLDIQLFQKRTVLQKKFVYKLNILTEIQKIYIFAMQFTKFTLLTLHMKHTQHTAEQ